MCLILILNFFSIPLVIGQSNISDSIYNAYKLIGQDSYEGWGVYHRNFIQRNTFIENLIKLQRLEGIKLDDNIKKIVSTYQTLVSNAWDVKSFQLYPQPQYKSIKEQANGIKYFDVDMFASNGTEWGINANNEIQIFNSINLNNTYPPIHIYLSNINLINDQQIIAVGKLYIYNDEHHIGYVNNDSYNGNRIYKYYNITMIYTKNVTESIKRTKEKEALIEKEILEIKKVESERIEKERQIELARIEKERKEEEARIEAERVRLAEIERINRFLEVRKTRIYDLKDVEIQKYEEVFNYITRTIKDYHKNLSSSTDGSNKIDIQLTSDTLGNYKFTSTNEHLTKTGLLSTFIFPKIKLNGYFLNIKSSFLIDIEANLYTIKVRKSTNKIKYKRQSKKVEVASLEYVSNLIKDKDPRVYTIVYKEIKENNQVVYQLGEMKKQRRSFGRKVRNVLLWITLTPAIGAGLYFGLK